MKTRFEPADFVGAKARYGLCLLHGNESDLIEERSATLTQLAAGSLDDPFRVTTLALDEHVRLAMEVTAGSLSGGRRVVRVRDCGERMLPALLRLTASRLDGVLVILLSNVLTARSKLRIWAEQSAQVAAILCNTDDAAQRRAFVDGAMARAGISADRDTMGMLLDRLPSGRRAIAAEVEKLALLAQAGSVDWDDARALLDGDAGGTVHAAIEAALAGDLSGALTTWEQAFQAGASGVGFVRVVGGELARLAALRAEIDRGTAVQEALQRQWIYPRDPRFRRWVALVQTWSTAHVLHALPLVHRAELGCKTTGSDERLVVSALLTDLAVNRSG